MRDALRDEMIKKICVRDADNILDVGCGDGTFLHELTRWKDVEGYGIDESEDKILIAKQTWPELHFETGYSDFLSFVMISIHSKIHRSLLMKHFVS